MEAAKASVKKIIGKDGKHDTTVHEQVAPAVQNENITRTEHEKIIPAVDREIHQEHHHTTVQPVQHSEVLQEQHHHTEMPMETRQFDHGKDEESKRALAAQQAQFRDTQTRVEGEKTRSTEGAIAGEHVHHHVHETIQPVIQKETVEPHVVHKTVPIHEVHHKAPQHHSAHALPAVSMDDFKKQGGSLHGREERSDFFAGEPKHFPGEGGAVGQVGSGTHGSSGLTSGTHGSSGLTSGTHGSSGLTSGSHDNSGLTSGTHNTTTNTSTTTSTSTGKPSMMDKLNPSKDATGDGQAGFMK